LRTGAKEVFLDVPKTVSSLVIEGRIADSALLENLRSLSHDFQGIRGGHWRGRPGLGPHPTIPTSSCWTWGSRIWTAWEVIHRLREWTKAPIIVLTARDKEEDKIAGLNTGADDYLTKTI